MPSLQIRDLPEPCSRRLRCCPEQSLQEPKRVVEQLMIEMVHLVG